MIGCQNLWTNKYKHLFKYNMENSPLKIRIHPNGKQMLLLSVTSRQKYEILVFKLPEKVLATSPKEEGLINNRELSLLCGCIESRTVLDCDFAPNEICAVLVLTPGKVDVLKRKDEASDLLVKTETFSMDKPGTQLKVVKEKIFVIGEQVQILGLKDFNLEYDGNLLDFVVQDSENIIAVTENSKIIESPQMDTLKKACVRIMENEKLLICVQNHVGNLFSCIYDSSDLDFKALDGVALDCEISRMTWLSDSRIILHYGKHIEILDIKFNRSLFSHEAPKKASEIMNFAVHPFLPNIVCCCDDSKSVQIFWHQT